MFYEKKISWGWNMIARPSGQETDILPTVSCISLQTGTFKFKIFPLKFVFIFEVSK